MSTFTHLRDRGLAKVTTIFLVLVHLLAIGLAYHYFTWGALVACVVLMRITGKGVTIAYHRFLTHEGFKTYRWFENLLVLRGVLSGQGPPLVWVAEHRKHHQFSDKPGDPHSPVVDSGLWAHVFWLMVNRPEHKDMQAFFQRYAPDLLAPDRWFIRQFQKTYLLWHLLLLAILAGIGWCMDGSYGAMAYMVWGFAVRMVYVYHCTWFVNSWSHMWGYRTHETRDRSFNNPLVALLTDGEGWHNNHHAHPRSVAHGERWWEIDLTYFEIWVYERLGLAWDLQR